MDSSLPIRLRPVRTASLAAAVLLTGAALALLVAGAAQLREASLFTLSHKATLSLNRVQDAEHPSAVSLLSALGLLILGLIALGIFLNRAEGLAESLGTPVSRRRILSDLWRASDERPEPGSTRAIWVGWSLLAVGLLLWIPTILHHHTASGRRFWGIGFGLIAVAVLMAAAYCLAVLLRFTAKTQEEPAFEVPARNILAVAGTAALIAVVGTGVVVVKAARLPDHLRITAADIAKGDTAITGGTTNDAKAPGYLLTTDGFTVQLPAEPTKSVKSSAVAGGTLTVTEWEVPGQGGDVIVEELSYPRDIVNADVIAKAVLDQTAKVLKGAVSSSSQGTQQGHPFHQGVITDPKQRQTALRAIGLRRSVLVFIASPTDKLNPVVKTLHFTS